MAIPRVSRILSIGVIALTLAPTVLGQGGGGGGGPPEEGTMAPSDSLTTSRGNSGSVSFTGTATSTSTTPPPGGPPDDSSGSTTTTTTTTTSSSTDISIVTVPPSPSPTSTATSAASVTSSTDDETSTMPPPRSTSSTSSMGRGSGSSSSSTSVSGTRPPLDSSEDGLPPPSGSSSGSGNDTGPPDGGGSSGGMAPSTDEIYFPWLYSDECDHYGEDGHYEVEFIGSGVSMVRQAWSTTGCPNHVNWGIDKGVDYHFPARVIPSNQSIPAYPMMFSDNGTTDLSTTNGQIATLVSGVAMFSAWAMETVVDYASTAFATEGYTLDACGGHSTTEGWYHYHGTPGCLEEQIMVGENISMSEHSPFLGWSYDGFPIYGHLGPGGIEMRACDTDGADAVYCLDTCNGYEGEIPEIDDFTYRYYLTCGYDDSYFPLTINCFRGCCPEGIECHETVEACDDLAEVGYSESYEPELGYVYSEQYELEVLSGDDGEYINSSTGVNCSMFYIEDLVYTVQQYEDTFPGFNGTSSAPTSGPTSSPRSSPTSSPTSSPSSGTGANEEINYAPGRHSPSRALYSLAGVAAAALGVLQWAA